MSSSHADVKGNEAAYVLGSLEPDERDAIEAHVATCGECAAEVQGLRTTAHVLAYAVPQRTPPAALRDRTLASFARAHVTTAPDLVRIDLAGQDTAPQSSGRALWSRARGMVFATSNLPAPPAGKIYQVWVVTAQAPISAGLVMPDQAGGGMTYFSTPPDIPAPTAVAVTLEPAGGVPAPTGQFFLVGKPAAPL